MPRRRKGKDNRSNRISKSSPSLSLVSNEIKKKTDVHWLDQINRTHLMVVCALISFVLYSNTLMADFTYDDVHTIKLNMDTTGDSSLSSVFVHDFWGNDIAAEEGSHKSWRPLTIIGFRVDYYLFGLKPWWYHLVNIITNALVCSIFASILWDQVHESGYLVHHMHVRVGIIVGAIIFACHPIHTEAVANITSRSEIYCALLCFVTVRFHQKCLVHNYILPLPLFFLPVIAALCKEPGITITLICAGRDIATNFLVPSQLISKKQQHLYRRRNSVCRVILLVLSATAYLLLRLWVCKGHFKLKTSFYFNPIHFAPQPAKFFTACWVQVRYMWLLIFPFRLVSDYSFNSIPLVEEKTDIRIFGILTLILILLVWTLIGFKRTLASTDIRMLEALSWIVFPLLPASHIVPIGTVLAERLLYIPSIGFCMALAILTEKLLSKVGSHKKSKIEKTKRIPITFFLFITIVVTCFSVRTVNRNFDWFSDEILFKKDVIVQPTSIHLLKLAGERYAFKSNKWNVGLEMITRSREILPTVETLSIGSRIYANPKNSNQDLEKAHQWADEALKLNESLVNMAFADFAKGVAFYNQNKFNDAIPYLHKAVAAGKRRDNYCFLGNAYCQANPHQFEQAIPHLKRCVRMWELAGEPNQMLLFDPIVSYAQALLLTEKYELAEIQYQKILQLNLGESRMNRINHALEVIRKKKIKKKKRNKL